MKRRCLTLIVALLLIVSLLPTQTLAVNSGTLPLDLRDHWSAPYAITLLERHVLSGYPNGRFYPEQYLSREEAVSILYKLMTDAHGELPQIRQAVMPYTDVGDRWSTTMISALWCGGILEEAALFCPEAWISRGDMARYTALCLSSYETQEPPDDSAEEDGAQATDGAEASSTETETQNQEAEASDTVESPTPDDDAQEELSLAETEENTTEVALQSFPFPDIAYDPNAAYIMELYERGIVSGYEDGLFHANGTLSRGEAAALFFKASEYPLSGSTFAPLPTYNVISVPYISQLYPVSAPVGCEAVSLLMGLKGKGYALDIDTHYFLDAMPKTTSNPAKGFVGSPYVPDPSKKTRTTIYPPILAKYGQQYGNVIDISGASVYDIQRELLAGNPVVVYVTLYWEKPYYRYYNIEGEQQRLLSNNHAVLVCGYDAETNQYYIADPYNKNNTRAEYFYWVPGSTFEPLYLERCHALTVAS